MSLMQSSDNSLLTVQMASQTNVFREGQLARENSYYYKILRLINYKGLQKFHQNSLQQQSKRIQKKKTNYVKKQFQIQYMPSYNIVNEVQTLFLTGEIFIILDFDNRNFEYNRLSCMNNYKRVYETIIHKQSRFIEIKLEQKEQYIHQFQQVAYVLKNYPDENIHELGILLELYYDFCQRASSASKESQSKKYESQNKRLNALYTREQFEVKKLEFLNSFNQEEFLSLVDMTYIPETSQYITNSMLISEPFLFLMGTTLEQYQRYILRYGVNSFVDSKSQLVFNISQLKQILFMYGDYIAQYPKLKEFDFTAPVYINLQTHDNLSIRNKISFQTIYPTPEQLAQHKCSEFQEVHMLIAVKNEIEPNSLKQIMTIREQCQKNQINELTNEIDYHFDYHLQSEIFMEMQKHFNSSSKRTQRASYKTLEQSTLSLSNIELSQSS